MGDRGTAGTVGRLSSVSKYLLAIAGVVLALSVGTVDYLTGPELSVSLFYLLPITLVTWSVTAGAGVLTSFLSAALWLAADMLSGRSYTHPLIPYWNATIRLDIFLAMVFVLQRLRRALAREVLFSTTDALTGVANSRHFYDVARIEIERARRYGHPVTMAYLDVDGFKLVNDRQGHAAGDSLLRAIVDTIRRNIRASDLVARLGGDEFAVLLPETGREVALPAVEKIRKALLDMARRDHWPITFSIGVAIFALAPGSVEDMIRQADGMMYAAKHDGKDRVKQIVVDRTYPV